MQKNRSAFKRDTHCSCTPYKPSSTIVAVLDSDMTKEIQNHPAVVDVITTQYAKYRGTQIKNDMLSTPVMFDQCSDICKEVIDNLNEKIEGFNFEMGQGFWNSNAVSMEFAKTWLYKFPGKKDFPRYGHNWMKVMRNDVQVGTIDLTYCQFISSAWHYDMCFHDWSDFYEVAETTDVMPNDTAMDNKHALF